MLGTFPTLQVRSAAPAVSFRAAIGAVLLVALIVVPALVSCGALVEEVGPGAITAVVTSETVDGELDGQMLSGKVVVEVEAEPETRLVRFSLGDQVLAVVPARPFVLRLDTSVLADGEHVLSVEVFAVGRGLPALRHVPFSVSNVVEVPRPIVAVPLPDR